LSIADKIVHTGDTNTAIRFPSPDTFAIETTGIERVRVDSTGDVGLVGIATATGLVVVAGSGIYAGHTGVVTAVSFDGNFTGNVTGAASQVTVADESSDTTCFPLFTTAATGDLPPKSGTNLTFNSSTGALTATSFVGALTGAVTGNSDTATTSTNVTVADESSDTTCFPLFATAATGNLPPKSGTNLTFNSSTGALTATSFVGALTGNVTGNISGGTVGGSEATFTSFVRSTRFAVNGALSTNVNGTDYAFAAFDGSSNLYASIDQAGAAFFASDLTIVDKIIHSGDTNTAIRFPAADTFAVETAGSEAIRVDSSGRLLVGTTTEGHSDADNLTVADSSKAGITIRNTTTTGDGAIFFSDATSGTGEYSGYIEYGHSDNHLRFATSSTEKLRITSGGDVHIGTTNAVVFGSRRALTVANGTTGGVLSLYNSTTATNNTRISSNPGGSEINDIGIHAASTNGNIIAYTNNDTERLRITSAGLVRVPDNGKFTCGAGDDLQIYHSGTYNFIQSGSTTLFVRSNLIEFGDNGGNKYIKCVDGGTTEIYHNANKKFETTTSGVTVTGTVSDTSGDLRITPISAKSGDYTLVATDTGKTITRTGGNITVPQSMTAGMIVTIINNASSTVSIIQGTNVTLRFTDSTTGTKTLAAYGVATVTYISASSAYITGTGLS
jgi:hypothetical protein